MKPQYVNGNVRAACPDCGGALANFEFRGQNQEFGAVIRNQVHQYEGRPYQRILYILMRCGGCGRGGVAVIHDTGRVVDGTLEAFCPASRDVAPLPPLVPADIASEFREGELCASAGAYRAASALLRSVLEKTLEANGYRAGSLAARIDDAANDGVLTAARRERAHQNIRVLGNDVLHDPWRVVLEVEYTDAHHYAQRILEDFYDNRPEVEAALRARGRL